MKDLQNWKTSNGLDFVSCVEKLRGEMVGLYVIKELLPGLHSRIVGNVPISLPFA
jgi:hypothetical protein